MVIAVLLVISAPAFALSDSEYRKMMKDPEFSAADANGTYTRHYGK